jgi:hypothetical protein
MRKVFVLLALLSSPAAAEDLSPWFGSTDQQPFQLSADGSGLDANVDTASTSAATDAPHLQCSISGCSVAEGSAKVLGTSHVSP